MRADLLLALLATRLATIAYVETRSELLDGLRQPVIADVLGGFKLLHFRQQKSEKTEGDANMHPQWFLLRGAQPPWIASQPLQRIGDDADGEGCDVKPSSGSALYLVFRGTWSTSDVIRDLCVEPEEHGGRGLFHGGFLKGVRDDPELQGALRKAMRGGRGEHLYIFGHSLGGSLAMALASSGLIPTDESCECSGVTVVAIGAPPVQQFMRASVMATGDGTAGGTADEDHAEKVALPPVEAELVDSPTRYLLIVNDCDVVPRLLGSPMPVAIAALLASTASSRSGKVVMERNVEILETMQQYSHPEGTEAILLREGGAKAVPPHERNAPPPPQNRAIEMSLPLPFGPRSLSFSAPAVRRARGAALARGDLAFAP